MASVSAQLGKAFAKIGSIFGGPYQQYRPISATTPLGNLLGTIIAGFDVTAMLTFRAPQKFGNALFYAAADPALLAVGDYLIGALGTMFVAGIEPNKPALCVQCNQTVAFLRPDADGSGDGLLPPGGQTPGTDNALMTGWPASVLIKTRGEAGQALLPGDTKLALFEVLVPAFAGVTLRTSDLMTDNLGRRFVLSAAEMTALGWRLYAQLSVS